MITWTEGDKERKTLPAQKYFFEGSALISGKCFASHGEPPLQLKILVSLLDCSSVNKGKLFIIANAKNACCIVLSVKILYYLAKKQYSNSVAWKNRNSIIKNKKIVIKKK